MSEVASEAGASTGPSKKTCPDCTSRMEDLGDRFECPDCMRTLMKEYNPF